MEEIILPSDVPFLPMKLLKAGDITCYYEAGNLRYIKWKETELVRMIYSALRDEHWNTLPMVISDEVIDAGNDGFSISYHASYKLAGINYKAQMHIEGHDHLLRFSMTGEALSSFKKNRVGLCVHHPLSSIGLKVRIRQADNVVVESIFPKLVSPHQPFTDIQSMEWTTATNVKATVTFEGEIFETEDQRNWSDASFKTYSTPLKFPIPATVNKGDKLEHTITLTATAANDATGRQLVYREEKVPFPQLGYCKREGSKPLTDADIACFRMIPFDHYRCTVRLYQGNWKDALYQAAQEAGAVGARLQLVAYVDDGFEMVIQNFIKALQPFQAIIASLIILHHQQNVTPRWVLDLCYRKLKDAYPSIQMGYGTDGNFADLNRNRPGNADYDFLAFSLQPQVHAKDNRTILENLESQYYIMETLRSFAASTPVHVSPISFNGTADPEKSNDALDPRQHTAFAAFWSLVTIQCLAAAGELSFYELKGKGGIVDDDLKPSVFYQVLKKIKAFNPGWVLHRFNNEQLMMDGLLLENPQGERLWISSAIKPLPFL